MKRKEEITPLKKVIENIKKAEKGKEKVILISTGSYNPAHKMHIEIFRHVKESFEKKNIVVVGSFISPSHHLYVSRKMYNPKLVISAKDRVKIINLLIKDYKFDDWLFVDEWEINQDGFVDFPYVTKSMRDYIDEELSRDTISRVIYVCGSDHVNKCWGLTSLRKSGYGVCALERPGFKRLKGGEDFFIVDVKKKINISSTEIRNGIKNGNKIDHLMSKSAIEYMKENKIMFE